MDCVRAYAARLVAETRSRIAARDAHAVGWKMKLEQEESLIAKRNPLPEGPGSGSQISSALAPGYEHRHTGTAVA
jgi:hypothetical protein